MEKKALNKETEEERRERAIVAIVEALESASDEELVYLLGLLKSLV